MEGYKLILRSEVPEWLRELADAAVIEAAGYLHIKTPVIRWHTGEGNLGGWVDEDEPDTINLVVDVMRETDAYTAKARTFHEVRHVWQNQTARGGNSRREREDDANKFAGRNTGYITEFKDGWEL